MIEYSIAVIAFAFSVLVIYLVIMLRTTRVTMNQLDQTLKCVQQKLTLLSDESVKLMEDIERKSQALDSLFQIISLIGNKALATVETLDAFKESSEHVKDRNCDSVQDCEVPEKSKVDLIVEWAALSLNIWQMIKRR